MPATYPLVSMSQIHRLGRRAPPSAFAAPVRRKLQLELLAPRADRVELLEAEADRIDQAVAGGAARIGGVLGHAVAIGLRLGFGDRRQVGIHAGRRIGHVLAEKLLAHEQAARGGRGILRLRRQRQEQSLAEQSGALRSGRERRPGRTPSRAPALHRWRPVRHSRSRSSAVNSVHEVAIVPDQVGDEARASSVMATAVSRVNCGNLRRSLLAVSMRSKRSHWLTNSSSASWARGSIEHAPRGLFDALRSGEFAARRRREQLRIGHGVPERIGEPAGRRVWLPLRIGGFIQPEQEIRRLQHRLDHQLRALQEIRLAAPSAFRSASVRPHRAAGGTPSARTRARTARGRQPKACTESARACRRRERRCAPASRPPRCRLRSAAAKDSAPATDS